jgi:hypothetical protein
MFDPGVKGNVSLLKGDNGMGPNWHKQRRSASSPPSPRLGAIVDKVNAGKMGESAAIAAPIA